MRKTATKRVDLIHQDDGCGIEGVAGPRKPISGNEAASMQVVLDMCRNAVAVCGGDVAIDPIPYVLNADFIYEAFADLGG